MKIDIFEMFLTRSISRDLLFGLIPIIVVVASVVGSINYFISANRGIQLLREQAEATTENLARILAHPIYKSKHSETKLIGQEYQQVLNVIFISISDEKHKTNYVYDSKIQDRHITVKKPIMLLDKKLGSVEVAFTMDSIMRHQKDFLEYTIILSIFTIIGVSIASILILEKLLGQPFRALIDGVSSVAAGSYGHILAPMKHRETNTISQSVNTMASKIEAREEHLKILVNKLEKQVVDRKKAERALRRLKERFEEMTNLLPETVYETNEKGYFTFLNRSGFERFGYSNEDIKKGLKLIDLFDRQEREKVEKTLNRALGGSEVGSSEYLAKNKKGKKFQALIHFSSIVHDKRVKGIRGIAVDITESKNYEKDMLLYQEKLRLLTKELLAAEERERRLIASELHDQVGHALTSVAIKIGLLRDTKNNHDKNIILNEMNKLIEQSAQDVQSLIFEISPPILYDIGLLAAIDWLIEKFTKDHELKIVLKHDDELAQISNDFRVLIFRAIRELLLNVIKHANAKYVEISIARQERNLVISVQDDGVGLPTSTNGVHSSAEGFGLFSIRERLSHLNGRLSFHSKPHQGTLVMMEIPDS